MTGQVRVLTTRETSPPLLADVHQLLREAFEGDFSDYDWEHTHGGWRVIALDDDSSAPVSHAAVVPRRIQVGDTSFRAGYVEGVATKRGRQGEGLGSRVMVEVSGLLHREFELGILATAVHGFYERLGWERWQGPTFVDDGCRLVRTADEDDGIMVLRVAPSDDIDLTGPISCQGRSGDDW
jgi:aminoglycoside 2'-N-acetyltransferase I